MSLMGQSRPSHPAPVLNNVRYGPVDAAAASLRLQPDLSWRRAAASVAQRQIAGMVNVSGGKMTLVEALAAWMNWPSVYPHCTPGVDLTGSAKSPKNSF